MEKPGGLRELSEMGEFRLIEHLTGGLKLKNKSSIKGVGDDAAVIQYGGELVVVTTDILTEGVHFDISYTPLKHLGYKAVVVNLSDVYAMNARPQQITLSLAVSNRFSVESLEELYSGVTLACEQYGIDLVGGDTTSSQSGMIICITAIGSVGKDKIVYRNRAGENDLVCVSGDLGAAYMGLQLLEREKKIFESDSSLQPDLSGKEYILERQLKPEARGDIVEALGAAGLLPTAMIDLSDGLSSDLLHICKQSDKGCQVYQEKIPIDMQTAAMAEEMDIEPFICALNGGEDYELLFTLPLETHKQVSAIRDVHVIGHMTRAGEGCFFVTREGNQIPLEAQGWDGLK